MDTSISRFVKIKRQVYLFVLPLIATSSLATLIVARSQAQVSPFDLLALPINASMLLLATVAVYMRKPALRYIEYFVYSVFSLVFLTKFAYSLFASYTQVNGQSELVQIYLWTPIIFLLAFFLFEKRAAIIASGSVFGMTLLAGISTIVLMADQEKAAPIRIFEFYLANGMFLILLYGLSNLRTRITQLRAKLVQMEQLAHLDVLTGVPNRRQLEATLKKELSAAERYGNPLSVISFDIDHFKSVNDTYGHDVGDYVLTTIADLVKEFLRDTDWFGRWGGEEFLVIAPQTDLKGAMLLADRLRALVGAYVFASVGAVTASFGVASYQDGDNFESIVKRADEALYLSKQYGRNRVEAVTREYVEHVQIPELYCPFKFANIHQRERADRLQRGTIEWLARFGAASKKKLYRLVSSINPGWLAAHIHIEASEEWAQFISDWYLWMFLYDDRCDESDVGKDPKRLTDINNSLLEVLMGAKPQEKDEPLVQLLYDLGLRLREKVNATWLRRFYASVEAYLDATVWEAENRAQDRIPNLDTYIRMRLFSSGLGVDSTLIECTDDIYIPEEVLKHPKVRELTRVADLAVCWANDIFSLNKEVHHNDIHNLILALQIAEKIPLQEAVNRAADMHDASVREFITHKQSLPSFGADIDESLKRYLTVLETRMFSNLMWSQTVLRYRPSELVRVSDEESKSSLVNEGAER